MTLVAAVTRQAVAVVRAARDAGPLVDETGCPNIPPEPTDEDVEAINRIVTLRDEDWPLVVDTWERVVFGAIGGAL